MTIHKAGTMLTLTNELGVLRGALRDEWDTESQRYPTIVAAGCEMAVYSKDWTITPDRTLPTTPGSVVRGDVDGEQETLAMSDSDVWFKLSGSNGWYMADEITNWTLLYDAATEGVSE